MSPDPIGGQLVDPQTLNRYSYVQNNPLRFTDPTGMYTCKDSSDCSSDADKAFEAARQRNLKSDDPDVVRGATAYGDANQDNGVTVGFADLRDEASGGSTTSMLGADSEGNLRAESDVTIDSNLEGTELQAAVGHEGSHVADAQDVVKSIQITDPVTGQFTVGQDITQYRSEVRAYQVTDSVFRTASQTFKTVGNSKLGTATSPRDVMREINRILSLTKKLTPENQGPSILNR